MNRKIINWLLLAFCLMMVSLAQAQQAGKISRVGYVSTVGSPDANFEELRQGLRDLGYVEGKNIAFEYRAAEGKAEADPRLHRRAGADEGRSAFLSKLAGDTRG